jgi:exosortase
MAGDWWRQPDLSHGLLIPPLALYFAWRRRARILAIPPAPHWGGLALVALSSMGYLMGRLGAEFFLQRTSFVLLLAGLAASFWGFARLRALAFPLVLLAAMVPLPSLVYNWLAAPLQLFASDIATETARVLGISVFRNGNVIHLAGTTLGVEEACSGLRSLSSLLVAALLIGQLQGARMRVRVLLFALATPLAIAMNVLRVAGTAVLADYREALAMGFYHSFSGWLVFVAGLLVLLALARFLQSILDGPHEEHCL